MTEVLTTEDCQHSAIIVTHAELCMLAKMFGVTASGGPGKKLYRAISNALDVNTLPRVEHTITDIEGSKIGYMNIKELK